MSRACGVAEQAAARQRGGMIRKLERWVWFGGGVLAFNGGMVNAVGLSCAARQTISHVTGTTSLFSMGLARHDFGTVARLGCLLGSFAGGAAVSGFVLRNATLQAGLRYAVTLWIESALLAVAWVTIRSQLFAGLCIATAACGLQNAMAGTYSGATLRTTHVTGIITDIGAEIGRLLRGVPTDTLRFRLHGLLLGSFMAGAASGALLYNGLGYGALGFPVALTAIIAVSYSVWRRHAAV